MHSKPFSSFGPPSSLSPTPTSIPETHPGARESVPEQKRNAGVGERRSWSGRVMAPKRRRRASGWLAERVDSSAKREIAQEEKRDVPERKKNDLFLRIEKAKELVRGGEYLAKHMPSVCDDLEDENRDELDQLPAELWRRLWTN